MIGTRTKSVTPSTLKQEWYVIDARDQVLGRLATAAAHLLRGKNQPSFTPHMNMGSHVIIINAAQIKVTGRKADGRHGKQYHHHSMYPGGLKTTSFSDMNANHPERVIELAIKGMLPKGPLGRAMFRRLRVYADHNHPHEAQVPAPYSPVGSQYKVDDIQS